MLPDNSIILILALGTGLVIGYVVRIITQASLDKSRQREAESIIDSARRESESFLKEAEIKAKEFLLELRTKFEEETREEKRDLQKLEKRLQQRPVRIVELLGDVEMVETGQVEFLNLMPVPAHFGGEIVGLPAELDLFAFSVCDDHGRHDVADLALGAVARRHLHVQLDILIA